MEAVDLEAPAGQNMPIGLHGRLSALRSSKWLQEAQQAVLHCKPSEQHTQAFRPTRTPRLGQHAQVLRLLNHISMAAAGVVALPRGTACLELCMTCMGWLFLPCQHYMPYRSSPRRVCPAASSLLSTVLIAGTATTPSKPVLSVTSGCSICFIASSTMVPSSTCRQHRRAAWLTASWGHMDGVADLSLVVPSSTCRQDGSL